MGEHKSLQVFYGNVLTTLLNVIDLEGKMGGLDTGVFKCIYNSKFIFKYKKVLHEFVTTAKPTNHQELQLNRIFGLLLQL